MRAVVSTLAVALVGCGALWLSTDGFRAITAEGARRVQIARHPEPVPAVSVQRMDGTWQALTNQNGPVLIEFIYTSCPTICQSSGGDFAELRDHLADNGLSVPMLSVSFDPQADDLPALRDYADLHTATGDPWTIVRPNPNDLPRLLRTFRVTVIPDGWGGYQHNVAVLLINTDGAFAGAFDTRDFAGIARAVETAL